MAPHIATNVSPVRAALMLAQCDEICKRLSIRSVSHRTDEPLTVLLQNQLKSLGAEVHDLRSQVTRYCIVDHASGLSPAALSGTEDKLLPTELAHALASVTLRIHETIELLDLYKREERSGHDGALNALFASRFILDRSGHRDPRRAFYDQDKLLRIGLGLKDIATQLSQPPKLPPIEGFQQLLPTMVDFWSQVEKQLSPRYVHPYETLADTPYIVDATATVGKGSYGTVQKFNHRRGGEPLAIKTVHKIFSDEDARKVLREIGVLEVCHHKNIIQLVEAFTLEEDDQSMHLVIIPWAPCTLESFLHLNDTKRQNRCPWFEPGSLKSDRSIYRIMYELADAVSYLHGRSIKHKDLKPENILLYREGTSQVTPLITDFGVSKIYMLNAKTNYQDSTYIYLAPEQHNMKASTLESDIWQLGCCFAELLAVAKGGTSTYRKLGDNSFRREGSSWCIAGEYGQFMKALAEICIPSNATLKRAYVITAGMLALDPADRLDIEVVKTAF